MSKIGFDRLTLDWFKSYLTRTQTVRFDGKLSDRLNVKTGIGQGTILGPLISIFYINDLISVTNIFSVNMYADDCILYSSGNDWKKMILTLQPELDRIHTWCVQNRLQLNVKKSNTLLIGSRSKLTRVDNTKTLNIGDKTLKFVEKYKYLGTTLDKEMSLAALLTDVIKSVLNKLFILRKLRPYITEKCAISIYKQTILPLFDYVGFMIVSCNKGLVINYGEGGATKWENRGSETFCAPPSRQGKTFSAPPFKEWKLFAPPPTIWLKLQATA